MSNEVSIIVTAKDRDAEATLAKEKAEAKKLGDELLVTSTKARKLGDEFKATTSEGQRGLDRLTGSIRIVDKGVADIDQRMGELKDSFLKTGEVDFLKEARKLEPARRDLVKFKDELVTARKELERFLHPPTDSSAGKKGGGLLDFDEWAGGLLRSASSAMKKLPGIVGDGMDSATQAAGKAAASNPLIAGGIAAGITLGAPAIGGALTAAIGLGGIAGGILLAAKDPKVGDAWRQVGHTAMANLEGAASPFVGVLTRGATRFEGMMTSIVPSMQKDFAQLTPMADRLFSGAASMVERLMPGVDDLIRSSGPALDMLAKELPQIGTAVSDTFKEVAAGSTGGASALHDLLVIVEATTRSTGALILATEKWYGAERALGQFIGGDMHGAVESMTAVMTNNTLASAKVGDTVRGTFQSVEAAITPVNSELALTGDRFKALSAQISTTRQDSDALAVSMADKLLNSMLSMDHAVLGFSESQTHLTDTLTSTGIHMDIHTAKSQQMREAVLSVVSANIRQYDTMVASGGSATQAAAAYDQNTGALIKQMRQAGFTSQQIGDLIGKYMAVPDKVNTDVAMHGLTEAINSLDDAIRLANHLDGRTVNTYVKTYYSTYGDVLAGSPAGRGAIRAYAAGGISGAAGGGPRSLSTMVGEHGRELVDLPPGSRVHSNPDTERMMAAGSGSGVARVEVTAAPGAERTFVAWLLEQLLFRLRTDPAYTTQMAGALT